MTYEQIRQLDDSYIAHTYGRANVCIAKGKNATCWDLDGKEYIDFSSGIGVNALGFCDEQWVQAVSTQAATMQHISNLYYTLPGPQAAQLLCEKTGYQKVFFGNSGAEANEGAIKTARKYSFDQYGAESERYEIVSLVNSFHGRTMATLTATGQAVFHNYFFPFVQGFSYAAANDMEDVKAKITDKTCAVMIEFVQGEGGVIPLDADFVQQLWQYCKERDILLIADEVQTGIGRTGEILASQHFGIHPDITTVAKALGGGLPIGAVLFGEKVEYVLGAGMHGTTFGANPVACAGAKVVLERMDRAFLDEVKAKGDYLRAKIEKMPGVQSVTGMGMMLGIQPAVSDSQTIVAKCIEKGLIPLTAKAKVRLLPPLTITYEEMDKGLVILEEVLSQL